MDCSLPVSSVNWIFQAKILEWVAISFSREFFWPRDRTEVSYVCILSHFNHVQLCEPMDCSLPGPSVCGILKGKNTGVGCHALLPGIFPTQGLNPRHLLGLLHCRRILYHRANRQALCIARHVLYHQCHLGLFPWWYLIFSQEAHNSRLIAKKCWLSEQAILSRHLLAVWVTVAELSLYWYLIIEILVPKKVQCAHNILLDTYTCT